MGNIVSFEVKNCYLGCHTCEALGYEVDHQKCISCSDSLKYFQRGDKLSDNTMNYIREDLSIGYYKDSFGVYRQCNSTCKKCESAGTTTGATCVTCKGGCLRLEVPSRKVIVQIVINRQILMVIFILIKLILLIVVRK